MSRIKSENTSPEKRVRAALHRLGFRFRLHERSLPGKPDIVLPGLKVSILVHGCFWHRHSGCPFAYMPKTRLTFWRTKFEGNVERDRRVRRDLRKEGQRVVVIWECQTKNPTLLEGRIARSLVVTRAKKPAVNGAHEAADSAVALCESNIVSR